MALYQSSLRWFETCSCKPASRGQPSSLAQLRANTGFYNLKEAQILIEQWRQEYDTFRPHISLDYLPPTPEAIQDIQTVMPANVASPLQIDPLVTLKVVQ